MKKQKKNRKRKRNTSGPIRTSKMVLSPNLRFPFLLARSLLSLPLIFAFLLSADAAIAIAFFSFAWILVSKECKEERHRMLKNKSWLQR
jgi:hypothetical protein